jgi:Domain of unknown function (DUF3601)
MDLSDLKQGQRIKVIREFKDFDGDPIPLNSEWTFIKSTYFAYDGGYTFTFKEGGIRLAEIDPDNQNVLNSFSSFFEIIA